MSLSVVNWNVEWATPKSRRTPEMLSRIDRPNPDVVCLTETHDELLSSTWPDDLLAAGLWVHGQARIAGRSCFGRGNPGIGSMIWGLTRCRRGRFVSGVTETSVGEVAVIGVCIPWFGSRTEARRGNGAQEAVAGS